VNPQKNGRPTQFSLKSDQNRQPRCQVRLRRDFDLFDWLSFTVFSVCLVAIAKPFPPHPADGAFLIGILDLVSKNDPLTRFP
jgi:hypothetical protein